MEKIKKLAFRTSVQAPFDKAVDIAKDALKAEGFGVLTEIDVTATLKKKLDKDFRKYVILGACNPPFALQALQADLEVGLLLPCNLIVYQDDQGVVQIAALNPVSALQVLESGELNEVAQEVSAKLRRVIDSIET
ncbi:MAG: DUF302 domain-containing protein [Deltaproteobacteria bacterium]|nr:DUF302 domain-containing protein [Deltaproteobacteria bacterium]